MAHSFSRRDFVKTSALAAAGLYVNPGLVHASDSPNEKLNIACIGTANRAGANVSGVSSENLVAFADVDSKFLGKQLEKSKDSRGYADFRAMLTKEEKNIEAVVVSTADHTHAAATTMALKMGKHVYCEKPLTHTVAEARLVAELAKKHKCVTQMGTQIHAGDNYRRVVELIETGAIGKVTAAHAWCGGSWSNAKFTTNTKAPETLDWDLFLGPAVKRPYSEGVHPFNWRCFWDYGTGRMGDMGCHINDLVFWALKLRHPTRVTAKGSPYNEVSCPDWVNAEYDFPARDNRPAVKLTWHDGNTRPEVLTKIKNDGGPDLSKWGIGVVFVGDKGMLGSTYGSHVLLPTNEFKDFKAPDPYIAKSIGHHQEWIHACKTGGETTCNFNYSGALTETVLLGTVAYRAGVTLEWDAKKLKATNTDKAAQFITKEYRKGWEVTGDS